MWKKREAFLKHNFHSESVLELSALKQAKLDCGSICFFITWTIIFSEENSIPLLLPWIYGTINPPTKHRLLPQSLDTYHTADFRPRSLEAFFAQLTTWPRWMVFLLPTRFYTKNHYSHSTPSHPGSQGSFCGRVTQGDSSGKVMYFDVPVKEQPGGDRGKCGIPTWRSHFKNPPWSHHLILQLAYEKQKSRREEEGGGGGVWI